MVSKVLKSKKVKLIFSLAIVLTILATCFLVLTSQNRVQTIERAEIKIGALAYEPRDRRNTANTSTNSRI